LYTYLQFANKQRHSLSHYSTPGGLRITKITIRVDEL